MKKAISVLLLCSLLSPSFLAAQSASSLGEEILSDLLNLNAQNGNLRQQLESLEQNSKEREQLLKELEANRLKRESLLGTLSTLVDEHAAAYKASLRKWKFSTILFGSLSAALTGALIYQGVSK
jgi:CRISPR/Cas system-associated endonuclease Cas3-HD